MEIRWALNGTTSTLVLETFLGGMEICTTPREEDKEVENLETFLGGMEIGTPGGSWRRCTTLKPSLVEWKLRTDLDDSVFDFALKPSLVEWKWS